MRAKRARILRQIAIKIDNEWPAEGGFRRIYRRLKKYWVSNKKLPPLPAHIR